MKVKRKLSMEQFEGDFWHPEGAPKDKDKLATYKKYDNGFRTEKRICGKVQPGFYFGKEQGERYVLTDLCDPEKGYAPIEGARNLMMPSHGSLNMALEGLPQGSIVDILYTGKVKIKEGKHKGQEANRYEVLELEDDDS